MVSSIVSSRSRESEGFGGLRIGRIFFTGIGATWVKYMFFGESRANIRSSSSKSSGDVARTLERHFQLRTLRFPDHGGNNMPGVVPRGVRPLEDGSNLLPPVPPPVKRGVSC